MKPALRGVLAVALILAVPSALHAQQLAARATLKEHDGPVRCVAFAPDGRTMATAGYEGTVVLWNVSKAAEGPTGR